MSIYRTLWSTAVALSLVMPLAAFAETAAPAASSAVPAITVSPVALMMLRDEVRVSGLVGPLEEVQVQPLIEGQPIEALEADVGDRVIAGTADDAAGAAVSAKAASGITKLRATAVDHKVR